MAAKRTGKTYRDGNFIIHINKKGGRHVSLVPWKDYVPEKEEDHTGWTILKWALLFVLYCLTVIFNSWIFGLAGLVTLFWNETEVYV